jgi:hypothetical protein
MDALTKKVAILEEKINILMADNEKLSRLLNRSTRNKYTVQGNAFPGFIHNYTPFIYSIKCIRINDYNKYCIFEVDAELFSFPIYTLECKEKTIEGTKIGDVIKVDTPFNISSIEYNIVSKFVIDAGDIYKGQ